MTFLLDTVTISDPLKSRPDRDLRDWLDSQDPARLYLSVLTVGEIWKGIARLRDSDRIRRYRAWVLDELVPTYQGRVLPFTLPAARVWGEITGEANLRGETLPILDSLIAATAIAHGLTVVTRNVADFERCGAAVHDPWLGA